MTDTPDFKFTPAEAPRGSVLTINQIVSYNLMRARRSHIWTQHEVAQLLERYTGRTWSNASVSAAERAWQGGRPRKFDANELVAFSKIFDLPVTYFLLPPEEEENARDWVAMRQFDDGLIPTGTDDPNLLMGLLPTAQLVEALSAHDPSLPYLSRMISTVRRYLGLQWAPPATSFPLKEDEDVDWSEVVRFRDAQHQAVAARQGVRRRTRESAQREAEKLTPKEIPEDEREAFARKVVAEAAKAFEESSARIAYKVALRVLREHSDSENLEGGTGSKE